jgi:3-methyladenine DNA glycosylase AlkC
VIKEKFSLKDDLFNAAKVHKIALEINAVYDDFEANDFEKDVLNDFPVLELKERMYHIREMLYKYLPNDYTVATGIILKALPEILDTNKYDDDFGDFIYAPYAEYVVTYGCTDEHLKFSLKALREITKRFSVEFAIRDFINIYPEKTLAMLEHCALSDNYHERRLASEGLRPKLPWAKKLTLDYKEPIRYLDKLYTDKTRYVTRSVANHLNDIAKIDAVLVIETLKRWKELRNQELKEMNYIINHALRTLVKRGNEDALLLLGYEKEPKIDVYSFILDESEVIIGDALYFNLTIEAKEDTQLMVDYLIHFKTKLGTLSPKVHKLKKIKLEKGEKMTLKKRHPFKANMSTRTLYEGEHIVEVQINGTVYASDTFMLKM